MLKKWAYICVLAIFCSSTCLAQEKSSFLKKLGTVLQALSEESSNETNTSNTETPAESSEERSSGSRTSQSSEGKESQEQNTRPVNTASEIKIGSPHSDYFFDAESCKVQLQGQDVVIELLITNKSTADTLVRFDRFTAFDNQGNQYSDCNVYLGSERGYTSVVNTLPKDIPVKMKFIIPGVDPEATKIARITLRLVQVGDVTIENITIPR